jgi:hypothetical protein
VYPFAAADNISSEPEEAETPFVLRHKTATNNITDILYAENFIGTPFKNNFLYNIKKIYISEH